MKQADDPKLADLKKLLKRLEKIDPETRAKASPPDGKKPTNAAHRRSPDAMLDRPANDAAPVDGLLQLKPRNGGDAGRNREAAPSELPVIVKQSMPATMNSGNDTGAIHIVIIASITAAIVSALATAGTVYWLNLESNSLAVNTPVGSTVATEVGAPAQQAAIPSNLHMTPSHDPASQTDPPTLPAGQEASATQVTAPDATVPETTGIPTAVAGTDNSSQGTGNEPDSAVAATPDVATADTSDTSQPAADGAITPPRPQLVGEPERTASTGAEPAAAVEAEEPSADRDNGNAPGQEFGPPQPAIAIASAQELMAALTSTNAVAAESSSASELEETRPAAGFLGAATLIGPGERGALSPVAERETLNARAETKAPTVAVFEAPSEAAQPESTSPATESTALAPDRPASAGAQEVVAKEEKEEKVAISTTQVPPGPQLGPGEVALSHPAEVKIEADEAIDFPLAVLGTQDALRGHYLILSGLKRGARPSTGSELMFDTWRIDVTDLPGLKLNVPLGFARRLHLAAELRRPDGTTREKTTFVLVMPGAAASIVNESEEAVGLPASVLRNVDDGEVQIDNGSLRAARLLFQRAAEAGSARAAMLLAATYDANNVAAFKTLTPPVPDNAEARRWYRRAAELGAPSAAERLQRLPGN